MNADIAHPWWLLAPILLLLMVVLTPRSLELPGEWSRAIGSNLRQFLAGGVTMSGRRRRLSPVVLLWVFLAAALATISFGQKDAPALRNLHARVVVIDLGLDEPGRSLVDRARHLLEQTDAVPTAVVAVTGHSFVVVPFTTDFRHIDRYLQVLDTEVMPVDGRAAALGIDRATALLRDNDIVEGQIIVFTAQTPPVDSIEVESSALDAEPIWFVVDRPLHKAWQRYASQFGARIVDPTNAARIHTDLERRRQRAVASTASIRQRRDLTPWLIAVVMALWLLMFFRREQS